MTSKPQATPTPIVDNDRVAITQWHFRPGEETGWHVHQHDYVVVYCTAAKHIVETRKGLRALDVSKGQSYFRARGIEHNVINAGANDVILVETELK
jgi:beta-alanine degradation protein BauB